MIYVCIGLAFLSFVLILVHEAISVLGILLSLILAVATLNGYFDGDSVATINQYEPEFRDNKIYIYDPSWGYANVTTKFGRVVYPDSTIQRTVTRQYDCLGYWLHTTEKYKVIDSNE